MKINDPSLTAGQLADRIGGQLLGDGEILITGLNEIHHVAPGDLCFVDHPKYYDSTIASSASVILIDRRYDCPPGKALIVTNAPFDAFNELVDQYRPAASIAFATTNRFPNSQDLQIGRACRIAEGVRIGDRVYIGDEVYIGPNVVIGDDCVIENGVSIEAGCIIGGNAFYFKRTTDGYRPFTSGGRVVLEENVSLGMGTTIARGVSSDTIIGKGCKLDAQVQIGHDCKIGPHCLLAAQVGIAGNTRLGEWCVLQGQVGVAQNLVIGPRTVILAKSGVNRDLEGDRNYFGYPARESRQAFREILTLRNLSER